MLDESRFHVSALWQCDMFAVMSGIERARLCAALREKAVVKKNIKAQVLLLMVKSALHLAFVSYMPLAAPCDLSCIQLLCKTLICRTFHVLCAD